MSMIPPFPDDEIEKKYYSISEVAKMLDVNPSLIRFWESEFDILRPVKNKNGERRFTKKDIEDLQVIYHLVKEKGYTLEGAKEYIKHEASLVRDRLQTIDKLRKLRDFLQNLRDTLT
ncbi:MerR family transcriptional regulator [Eisenibacter elegans]|uniref:MerR family transcriptional regulator n=1 Tax=Eisenibacter elegans TaxID=997 RepID=UPI000411956F|nr:MerR family transcriptional regulator [Eisenibacter elegans]